MERRKRKNRGLQVNHLRKLLGSDPLGFRQMPFLNVEICSFWKKGHMMPWIKSSIFIRETSVVFMSFLD